jgi:hypothetical protein
MMLWFTVFYVLSCNNIPYTCIDIPYQWPPLNDGSWLLQPVPGHISNTPNLQNPTRDSCRLKSLQAKFIFYIPTLINCIRQDAPNRTQETGSWKRRIGGRKIRLDWVSELEDGGIWRGWGVSHTSYGMSYLSNSMECGPLQSRHGFFAWWWRSLSTVVL